MKVYLVMAGCQDDWNCVAVCEHLCTAQQIVTELKLKYNGIETDVILKEVK
jgi:hypothetical protein